MNTQIRRLILVGLAPLGIGLTLGTTTDDTQQLQKREYNPVYMTRTDLEHSVKYIDGQRPLQAIGKIYYHEPYIYVNERYKGVYVINNSNPTEPKVEGYICAPGSLDIAIKGNIMYIDNAVDLVGFAF